MNYFCLHVLLFGQSIAAESETQISLIQSPLQILKKDVSSNKQKCISCKQHICVSWNISNSEDEFCTSCFNSHAGFKDPRTFSPSVRNLSGVSRKEQRTGMEALLLYGYFTEAQYLVQMGAELPSIQRVLSALQHIENVSDKRSYAICLKMIQFGADCDKPAIEFARACNWQDTLELLQNGSIILQS